MNRLLNFLVALDQLLYVIGTLGHGQPDETASAAAYRTELDGRILGKFFRPIVDGIFFFDKDHCKKAYESEELRLQLPSKYKK